jgi:hypothetical protein
MDPFVPGRCASDVTINEAEKLLKTALVTRFLGLEDGADPLLVLAAILKTYLMILAPFGYSISNSLMWLAVC